MGTDGAGSGMHIYPTALNALVNTKFKIIDGYAETGGVLLAIDRGEVQGACLSSATITQSRGEALRSGRLRFILQGGLAPDPRFPDVPFVARSRQQRRAAPSAALSLLGGSFWTSLCGAARCPAGAGGGVA